MNCITCETTLNLVEFLKDYQPFWDDYYKGMKTLMRNVEDSHDHQKRMEDIKYRSLHNTGENFMLNCLALKHAARLWATHTEHMDVYHLELLRKAGIIEGEAND